MFPDEFLQDLHVTAGQTMGVGIGICGPDHRNRVTDDDDMSPVRLPEAEGRERNGAGLEDDPGHVGTGGGRMSEEIDEDPPACASPLVTQYRENLSLFQNGQDLSHGVRPKDHTISMTLPEADDQVIQKPDVGPTPDDMERVSVKGEGMSVKFPVPEVPGQEEHTAAAPFRFFQSFQPLNPNPLVDDFPGQPGHGGEFQEGTSKLAIGGAEYRPEFLLRFFFPEGELEIGKADFFSFPADPEIKSPQPCTDPGEKRGGKNGKKGEHPHGQYG